MTEQTTKEDTVLVKLKVGTIRPDTRQYMQQTKELWPTELTVGVEVPAEYFVDGLITPEGLRYLTDQLESAYKPKFDEFDELDEFDYGDESPF